MFITFEGIEGVGKTTQLNFVAEQLEKAKISVLKTREPGGTPMGEEIRDILLAHRHERVAPMTELLLMFSARAQHLDTVIRPALQRGRWVLCDRFVDASYAYQGGGRGISLEVIKRVEEVVLEGLKPDLVIVLDLPVEVGLKRIQCRANHDRFEQEKMDFFEKVRATYLERAKQDPKRYQLIDASKPLREVQQVLLHTIETLIQQKTVS